jgi:hypothetical protein
MKDKARAPAHHLGLFAAWWFIPLFITCGQLLMGLTGYTAWARQAGQEFMLSFMFYMALLGVVLGIRCVWLLDRLLRERAPPSA